MENDPALGKVLGVSLWFEQRSAKFYALVPTGLKDWDGKPRYERIARSSLASLKKAIRDRMSTRPVDAMRIMSSDYYGLRIERVVVERQANSNSWLLSDRSTIEDSSVRAYDEDSYRKLEALAKRWKEQREQYRRDYYKIFDKLLTIAAKIEADTIASDRAEVDAQPEPDIVLPEPV